MSKQTFRTIAKNRRAYYDYDIVSEIVAGIVLSGPEAKSIRNGSVSLKSSYATFRNQELWATNMHITQYGPATTLKDYDPVRPRKLLLHKKQLAELKAKRQDGKNIVILAIGRSGRFLKVLLGVGVSKKLYDKRHGIKRREQQREIEKRVKR